MRDNQGISIVRLTVTDKGKPADIFLSFLIFLSGLEKKSSLSSSLKMTSMDSSR